MINTRMIDDDHLTPLLLALGWNGGSDRQELHKIEQMTPLEVLRLWARWEIGDDAWADEFVKLYTTLQAASCRIVSDRNTATVTLDARLTQGFLQGRTEAHSEVNRAASNIVRENLEPGRKNIYPTDILIVGPGQRLLARWVKGDLQWDPGTDKERGAS